MSENEFTPKVGRIGDKGRGAYKRYGSRVRKAAAKLAKPTTRKAFSGARLARGTAAGRAASFRSHPFAKFRMRRVIVKTHIARAGKGIGRAAFRAHVNYIQRDGVSKDAPDAKNQRGVLYDKTADGIDDEGFLARSEEDRHQFRVILSAEDGAELGNLKETTRAFMTQMEKDLGTSLDWVAVDHWNTGHPHTHIVIRGKDRFGDDLVIAREYLTKGMRRMASELVTERLGPRRDLEIARSKASEVTKDRLTAIDRMIGEKTVDSIIHVGAARDGHDRFERTLTLRRLKHLESLQLAEPVGDLSWRLAKDWTGTLSELGKRGDIIRSLSMAAGEDYRGPLAIFEYASPEQRPVIGRVVSDGAQDELRDTRFLVVDGIDGKRWHVALGAHEPGALPPADAIIAAAPQARFARASDRTIAQIAAVHRGRYSEAIHAADDPKSSAGYREAHKRRLEALRRAGVVERLADGSFVIPENYLERAAAFEAERTGGANVTVKSWVSLDVQIEARAPVWLDGAEGESVAREGFGAEAKAAAQKRAAFLKREGINPADPNLASRALARAGAKLSGATGMAYSPAMEGVAFAGVYQRSVDLPQGRFALIAKSKEFMLVPWRPAMERQRGRSITVKIRGSGIEWTVGAKRGLAR